MRVFNKEVTMCARCPHINQPDNGYHSESCNYEYLVDIEDPHVIAKNCPFNKPITKESFKELGLKLISDKNNWCEFRNDKCDLYVNLDFQKPTHLNIHSRGHSFIGNCKPKVNNPEELEFILRSIGVIK
jgi:hypothetical protein